MSDYFDGAVMAYRDAADFIKHLHDDMPTGEDDVSRAYAAYIKDVFSILQKAMLDKSNAVLLKKFQGQTKQ